jgi:thiamine-monophosphate kinase
MKINKENFFIKQFTDKRIGDDGAVVLHKKGKWVYSSDSFFEDVHFKMTWLSLEQIAHKAMLVNISDVIVMNAKPTYALLNVAIPHNFDEIQLTQLANGFKKVAKQYNIKIIGGDTIANDKLHISITLISKTKNPTYRTGATKGDMVCYTGDIGSVQKDLNSLLQGQTIDKNSKFIKPQLKFEFFKKISKYTNCAMDISDGLCFELERLSRINDVGFEFLYDIPYADMCSGEEYEILFVINPKHQQKVLQIANKQKVALNFFAVVRDGIYRHDCAEHHFEKYPPNTI